VNISLEVLKNFFMWCSIFNYLILISWVLLFLFAHNPMKKFIEFIFRRKFEYYDTLHFAGISLYKTCIIIFNIVPWIVLAILTRK
jgi:hypothetical protein